MSGENVCDNNESVVNGLLSRVMSLERTVANYRERELERQEEEEERIKRTKIEKDRNDLIEAVANRVVEKLSPKLDTLIKQTAPPPAKKWHNGQNNYNKNNYRPPFKRNQDQYQQYQQQYQPIQPIPLPVFQTAAQPVLQARNWQQ